MNTNILVGILIGIILLILLGLSVVNYSFDELVEKYKDYSKIKTSYTPMQFAQIINGLYFSNKIKIRHKNGYFCDCFNSNFILTLSSNYANEYNLAGLAIVAHELGHGFQFKNEPKRMKKYVSKLKASRFFSYLISPAVIAGIICLILSYFYFAYGLFIFGGISLVIALLAKFSTIKLENDASAKAMELLEQFGGLNEHELNLSKKFLNSARQTYVAELLKIMLKWTMLCKK